MTQADSSLESLSGRTGLGKGASFLPGPGLHGSMLRGESRGGQCHRNRAFWAVGTIVQHKALSSAGSRGSFQSCADDVRLDGLVPPRPRGLSDMLEKGGLVLQLLRWDDPAAIFQCHDLRDLICTSFVKLHFADKKARLMREMTQPKESHCESESSVVDVSVSPSLCSRQEFSFK